MYCPLYEFTVVVDWALVTLWCVTTITLYVVIAVVDAAAAVIILVDYAVTLVSIIL